VGNQILSGTLIYSSADGIGNTFANLIEKLHLLRTEGAIPQDLFAFLIVMSNPDNGPFVATMVSWASSDKAAGQQAIEKVAALGTIVANTVTKMSPAN
jgi:hypothetical protein